MPTSTANPSRHRPSDAAPATLVVAGLVAMAIGGCGTPPIAIELEFRTQPDAAVCGDVEDTPAALSFYVADIALIDAAGDTVPVRLHAEPPWQDERLALIALGLGCGAGAANATVPGTAPAGSYHTLAFSLGVPFERNHGNPLVAPPPLGNPAMFWVWQSGHKFLRLDAGDRWSFHLGSTGCVSAAVVRPPTKSCQRPNLARVRLPWPGSGGIVTVDLGALLEGIDAGARNCVGSYHQEPACARLLEALGLDAASGQCVDGCAGQRVFRTEPMRS